MDNAKPAIAVSIGVNAAEAPRNSANGGPNYGDTNYGNYGDTILNYTNEHPLVP